LLLLLCRAEANLLIGEGLASTVSDLGCSCSVFVSQRCLCYTTTAAAAAAAAAGLPPGKLNIISGYSPVNVFSNNVTPLLWLLLLLQACLLVCSTSSQATAPLQEQHWWQTLTWTR
jgi:hypothetical protein